MHLDIILELVRLGCGCRFCCRGEELLISSLTAKLTWFCYAKGSLLETLLQRMYYSRTPSEETLRNRSLCVLCPVSVVSVRLLTVTLVQTTTHPNSGEIDP